MSGDEIEIKEEEIPEGMHVDIPEEEVVLAEHPLEEDEVKHEEEGVFGVDKEIVDYMFSQED